MSYGWEYEPSSNSRGILQGTRFRFEIQIQEALVAINDAISTLELLKKAAKANHDNVNIAKTVGTVASAGGTTIIVGAALLVPFTGGASLVYVVGGFGLIAGIGGAATNVATTIIDNRLTKECIEKLERCLRNVDTSLKNLNMHIETFVESLDLLKQKHHLKGDTETLIMKGCVKLIGQQWKGATKAVTLLSSKEIMDSVKTMRSMGSLTIEGASGSFQLVKPVEQFTRAEHKAIQLFAKKGGPATVSKITTSLISKVSLLLSIASSIYEVFDLMRKWNSNPAEEAVDKAISTLLEERAALESLISAVTHESSSAIF